MVVQEPTKLGKSGLKLWLVRAKKHATMDGMRLGVCAVGMVGRKGFLPSGSNV